VHSLDRAIHPTLFDHFATAILVLELLFEMGTYEGPHSLSSRTPVHSTVLIDGNQTKMRWKAWCSWCREYCEQEPKKRNSWSRSIFECVRCEQRTLQCSRPECQNFARGFLVPGPLGVMVKWHESCCIVCQGLIKEWACPEPSRQQDGWCFCALDMADCVCFRALNMPDCVCSCLCAFDVCVSCVVLSLCAA
jgi:hypothetical protein